MYPCKWWWNGADWQLIAGFCPLGQSCEKPTGSGNPGEFRDTQCV
jgi:hypothetical protein